MSGYLEWLADHGVRHDCEDHPWADCYQHEATRRWARSITLDIVEHERWGVDQEPTYDPADGLYVGDSLTDDRVAAQTHLLRLFLPRGYEMTPVQITDVVYRRMMGGRVERYERLLAALEGMVADGRLVAHEDVRVTAARAARHGYDV